MCHAEGVKKRAWGYFGGGTAAVVVLAALGIIAYDTAWFSDSFLAALTVVGVIVSGGGLFAAYLIFAKQRIESDAAERRQGNLLGELRQIVHGIDKKMDLTVQSAAEAVSPDKLNEGQNEEDAWHLGTLPDEVGVLFEAQDGTARRQFTRDETSLRVISDLVKWWEDNLDENGAWTVGDLVGGFRSSGQGNHPWFLVFARDENPPVVWKVSKGRGSTIASKIEAVTALPQ